MFNFLKIHLFFFFFFKIHFKLQFLSAARDEKPYLKHKKSLPVQLMHCPDDKTYKCLLLVLCCSSQFILSCFLLQNTLAFHCTMYLARFCIWFASLGLFLPQDFCSMVFSMWEMSTVSTKLFRKWSMYN